jgi:FKBP-type peptidyl-prolyl cis-trans isomerase 2
VLFSLCASRTPFAAILFVAALGFASANAEESSETSSVVSQGNRVSIEYTLKLDDGNVADSNVGGEALTYEQGAGHLLPALEKALLGLKVGDTKQLTLGAKEGYGEVDDTLYQTVPATAVPEDVRRVGMKLVAEAPTGKKQLVRIHKVNEAEVVMDLNHPLAGQSLHFDVKILEIE